LYNASEGKSLPRTIHVKVSGRTVFLLGDYPRKRLTKHWSFTIPQWHFIKDKYAYFDDDAGKWKYRWDGTIKLLKNDCVPAGLFWATYKEIEKEEHFKFKIKYHHKLDIHVRSHRHWVVSAKSGASDFRYQNKCVDQILEKAYKGGGLVLSATGSGKTRMAAQLASRYHCEFLFIVDQINLLDQAQADIQKHLGEDVGNVGEQKFNLKRFTVATIQTLHLHMRDRKFFRWFQNVDVILIDELHEMLGKRNEQFIQMAAPKLVIGLTATLNLKQKHIRLKAYSLCGPVMYEFPLKKGQEAGVLSKGIAVALKYDNTIHEIDAYDAKSAYNRRVVGNAERNYIISRIIKRAHKLGYYTIALVDRLKHLEEISERLHGIPRRVVAGSYKGTGIPKLDRVRSKTHFEKGKIRVIIASKVFKKGISINRVDVIIDCAARRSKEDAVQKYGRGVRLHKHKHGLIYIDISDYDRYDADRKDKNWLYVSARRRKRALRAAGVPVFDFQVDTGSRSEIKSLFRKAEKWLRKTR
jgi:superfamily II DNA or RNA helicase